MIVDYKYIKYYKEFIEPNDKYNIISCSVFRLIDNYKNEYMYTTGLNRLLNQFELKFPNYYLRIYYDNSVLDYHTQNKKKNTYKIWQPLFDNLRKNPKVQMVRYEMQQFKLDKIHHKGLIGTIIRLHPLFDTEENKNIKNIMVFDIDIEQYEIEDNVTNYNKMLKANVDFFYRTRNCYDLQDRFQILTKYFNIKFPIMAGTIMSKIKFPIKIFDNFFECLLNKNDKDCEYYKAFDDFSYGKHHSQFSKKNEFKYGVDETLTMLIKEYLYKNKIKHLIYVTTDLSKPFYNIYIAYDTKIISEIQFKNILKFILSDNFDDKLSVKENYTKIDNVVFFKKENNKLSFNIILDRAKELINNIENNKLNKNDYGFDNPSINASIDCLKNSEYKKKYYIIDYINQFTKDNIQKIDFE